MWLNDVGQPMSGTNIHTPKLPTAEDVAQWRAELEALEAYEAEMKARHAAEEKAVRDKRTKLNRLVAAGSALVGLEDKPQPKAATVGQTVPQHDVVPGTRMKRRKRQKSVQTWRATIYKIIKEAGRPIPYAELKEAVAQTHLGERLEETDKSFYGSLRRLDRDGKIVRHNGRAFLPEAYRQFMEDVKAGRAVDGPIGGLPGRGSPNFDAIRDFLAERPNGATGKEILDSLLNEPPKHLDVSRNRGSLQNALTKMRDRTEIEKRGDRYYLPRAKSEAPDPAGPSASQSHHNDEGGTSSSSGSEGNGSLAGSGSQLRFRAPARHTPRV